MTPDLEQALLRHAVGRGLLSAPQAQRALEVQARERAQGRPQDVLTVLQRLGLRPEVVAQLAQAARGLPTLQEAAPTLAAPPPVAPTLDAPPPAPRAPAAPGDPLLGQAAAAYARAAASCPRFAPHAEHALEHVGALGEGGMGVVLRVKDRRLGREAALKLMRDAADPVSVARFVREAEITARLDHPAIPPVYEAGVDPRGRTYMLMRLIDGQPLSERIAAFHAAGRTPAVERELLEALVKVTEAVAYAHSQGVLHRDLKPANVMVGKFGEVLVMDWGLARDDRRGDDLPAAAGGGPAAAPGLTQVGATMGTPGYMPPEQAGGEAVDARADVFALAAILTEVLTGAPPVTGNSVVNLLTRTLEGKIERPSQRRADVAPELDAIAAAALAADPARRTPDAEALLADLRAYLAGEPVAAHRYTLRERLVRAARRRPTLLVAGLAGLLLASVASWAAVWVARSREQAAGADRRAREEARAQAVAVAASAAAAAREAAATAGAEARLGAGLGWLQAAQRWRDLAPDDPASAGAQVDAALALHRTALAQEQWALAEQVLAHARGLGRDDEVAAGAAEVARGRDAAALRRREAVEAVLARVEAGEARRRPNGRLEAAFEVVRQADPGVVALLVARLDEVTAALRRSERAALLEGLDGSAAAALGAALDRRDALAPDAALPGDVKDAVEGALARLEGGRPRRGFTARPALALLAARQASDAGEERLDLASVAADALGRLGLGAPDGPWPDDLVSRTVAALGRLVLTAADEHLAASAARALVRIGGAQATRLLSRARERFGANSDYARQVGAELALAGPDRADADLPEAPTRARAHARRAQERLERGDVDGAAADVERALAEAVAPDDRAAALSARSYVARQRGDLRQARADLEDAIREQPDAAVLRLALAGLLLLGGDVAGAEAAATEVLRRDPASAEALLYRGDARRQRGDRQGALADLDEAIRLEPRVMAYGARASVREALGDTAGALADFDAALALDDQQPMMWTGRALVRLKTGDPAGARADANRAVDLAPRDPRVWYGRGLVRAEARDLEGARRDLDQALERDPDMWAARLVRAEVLHGLGEPEAALGEVEQILRRVPNLGAAWALRARVRLDQGEPDAAAGDVARALGFDPNLLEALAVRGQLRAARGDAAGALEDLDRVLRQRPGAVDALCARAALRAAAGELPQALADLDRALEARPDHPAALVARGEARAAAGDRDGAIADLSRLLDRHPSHRLAARSKELLEQLRGR